MGVFGEGNRWVVLSVYLRLVYHNVLFQLSLGESLSNVFELEEILQSHRSLLTFPVS